MKVLAKLVLITIITIIIILNFGTKLVFANTISGRGNVLNLGIEDKKGQNQEVKQIKQMQKMAKLYLNQGDVDNAIKYLEKVEAEYNKLDDLNDASNTMLEIIRIGTQYQKYTVVVQYGLLALNNLNELYKETGEKKYIQSIEAIDYMMAIVFNMQGELSYGKEYFNVAQKINKQYNVNLINIYFIKSNYYYYQNDFNLAKEYVIEGMRANNNQKNKLSKAAQLMYLTRAQTKLNELSQAKANLNYISKNLNNDSSIIKMQYYYDYAEIYEKEKEWHKSINYYLNVYKYLQDKNLYLANINVLENLAKDYSNIGDYKTSCKYYSLYVKAQVKLNKSKQMVNTTMLVNIYKNNPQNILNEIYIKKSKFHNQILSLFALLAIILGILFAWKYAKRLKNEKKLSEELDRDLLTRAYNRRYAINLINKFSKNKKQFSLAMIDIDNYKSVNDKYGHIFGDEVLVRITRTMRRVTGDKVSVTRYGGEEFLLIIESEDIEYSYKVVEIVRRAIESLDWAHGNVITISAGLSHYSEGKDVLELLDKADALLYRAKDRGKNRVEYKY